MQEWKSCWLPSADSPKYRSDSIAGLRNIFVASSKKIGIISLGWEFRNLLAAVKGNK